MSTPYIAANTEGLSVSPAVIARGSVAGDSRPTGVPGRHVVRLRAQQRRSTCGEARFRLRDVGARHLADIEAVTSLFQLLGEHFDVATIKIEDRLVAQQIHVGSSGVKKDLLFGNAQCLARARDLAFRLPRAIGGLKSVVKRLRRSRAELPGTKIFANAGVVHDVWKYTLVFGFVELIKIIKAARRGDTELWPVA